MIDIVQRRLFALQGLICGAAVSVRNVCSAAIAKEQKQQHSVFVDQIP